MNILAEICEIHRMGYIEAIRVMIWICRSKKERLREARVRVVLKHHRAETNK